MSKLVGVPFKGALTPPNEARSLSKKLENLRLKVTCQVLISNFRRDDKKCIGRWSPSVCITVILWFYVPWINFSSFSVIKNAHTAHARAMTVPLSNKLKLITQTQSYLGATQPHTIHSTRKKLPHIVFYVHIRSAI